MPNTARESVESAAKQEKRNLLVKRSVTVELQKAVDMMADKSNTLLTDMTSYVAEY